MPAVHISEFQRNISTIQNAVELQINSFTLLYYLLGTIASQRATSPSQDLSAEQKVLVTVFPSIESLEEAFTFAEAYFAENKEVKIQLCNWMAWEHSPFSPIASSLTQKIERLKTLSALKDASEVWIFTTAQGWIQPTLPRSEFSNSSFKIQTGAALPSREVFQAQLRKLGYVKTDLVDEPGQFAMRGEIIDIFEPSQSMPLRIELFDVEIERIRYFDPETQRTLSHDLSSTTLYPAEEVLFPWDQPTKVLEEIKKFCDERLISRKVRDPLFENIKLGFLPENFRTWLPFVYQHVGHLKDYLPSSSTLVLIEPERIFSQINEYHSYLIKEEVKYEAPHWIAPSKEQLFPSIELIKGELSSMARVLARTVVEDATTAFQIYADKIQDSKISKEKIVEWIDDGFKVLIGAKSLSHQERIKYSLGTESSHPQLKILSTNFKDSFQIITEKTILISDSLIVGKHSSTSAKPSNKKNPNAGDFFRSVKELAMGDYVVHSLHGVGKYLGLHELKLQGKSTGEYLHIEYANGDRLYLPTYRLNLIQKHVGAAGNPSLDKLGNNQFEKAKQKAKEGARKLAVNLLEIYAKRATLRGPRFDVRGEEYEKFCDEFQFTETEGQLNAVDDVLSDVESGKLLDRLVCGDVGFGKTEVAMRAAFQAVQSGYQVAVLVPTTLLAFQHEQTFKSRMQKFPIRIESISRFKTKAEQKRLLTEIEAGKIDIIVGTHRLLSKDIKFSKIGLLIIDEEHRFGVEHKEKIKALQASTHALTLTATPIPRTLNMAISGIKDISIIKTPPTNRQPIKTFVSSYADELVKSAIETELSRGGQIFYLYNRVQSIEHRAREIQRLVPHAKVITAHGQMTEDEIETRMLEFYQGRAQVLVCTTIIESGIDIPNAGTIIIHRADQLGLAQLYQIRGRVGRSHRRAFAYLLVYDQEVLSQEAKLRLEALQRFVELGSGFQIASEDLEIRGGGNLLGAEQSGHIVSVGLDLFTELLEESIRELRGQSTTDDSVEERHFEPEIQVPVTCEISQKLIPDSQLRLSFYRKLSRAQGDTQVDELLNEFIDRFGNPNLETENLFWLIRIKNLIKLVGIETLNIGPSKTSLGVRKTSKINADEAMKVYMGPKSIRDPRFSLTPDSKIIFALPFVSLKDHLFELEALFKKIAPKAFENTQTH